MKRRLLGAICGDVIGSVYEHQNTKDYNFDMFNENATFTDDTVCTIAIADALLHEESPHEFKFSEYLKTWCRKYPERGFGQSFRSWFNSDKNYLNTSWGNGSAMRVSPIGYYAKSAVEASILAHNSCFNSHASFEAIKGAKAIAECITCTGMYKNFALGILHCYYPEFADISLEQIKPTYAFEVSCQKSVPIALLAVAESSSYEDCIRKAISVGGDSDTIAAMAGGIAYKLYGYIPEKIVDFVTSKLDDDILKVIDDFDKLVDERNKY